MKKTTDEIKQELAGIADYLYNENNWEYTTDLDNAELVVEDLDIDTVYEVGMLKKLPSKFFISTFNSNGDYLECWADTKEEAEEFLEKHKAKEE